MTPQNQPSKALPNVLHDQTAPNTLGGISPPAAPARRPLPTTTLAIAAGVVLALIVAIVARAA